MSIVRFGPFEVDRDSGELRGRGLPIRLREQPIRVLLALLDSGGRVVTREELRHRLWPDGVFVEFDRAINKAVCELRRALDRPGERSLVETVSKRGYRLAAGLNDASRPCSGFVRAATGLPTDAAAAYVTGRYLFNRRRVPDLFTSIACFKRTLALGGDEASAHAGLANARAVLGIWGVHPPDRAFGGARRSAIRALDANPGLAEGQNAFAEVLKGYEWSWGESESHYRRALSIDAGMRHRASRLRATACRSRPTRGSDSPYRAGTARRSGVSCHHFVRAVRLSRRATVPSRIARSETRRGVGTCTRRWRIGPLDARICFPDATRRR